MLNESKYDNAALKLIFLAGGPGSGKNHVANQLFGIEPGRSFGSTGMKLVSFDSIFEQMLKKKGYPKDLTTLSPEEQKKIMDPNNSKSIYNMCRSLVKKQLRNYMYEGTGVIFDGTGQNISSYLNKKDMAEDLGYDTHLIFVDTPLKTALKRNASRARKLPEETVAQIYRAVKQNKAEYKRIFGNNMLVVNNAEGAELTNNLQNAINKIVTSPVKNPIGQEFLHGGMRKPKQKPNHKADPLPKPTWSHAQPDGSHKTFTKDGSIQHELMPGAKEKISKEKASDKSKSWKDRSLDWWTRFNMKQKEKINKSGKSDITQQRIHNPETGNDILVTTALGYAPDHPMRIAAEKFLKK